MAERRMFTKKITDDDNFTSLSSSAQALYFHLNTAADDDGFNNQVSMAMWKAHASVDDLKVLMAKDYIIRFESGVIVIRHWRMHNTLRKDRYTPTNFQEELRQLGLKDNGEYMFGCRMVAERLPSGCHSIGKDSIGKDSEVEEYIPPAAPPKPQKHKHDVCNNDSLTAEFETLWKMYPNKKGKKAAFASYKRARKKGVTFDRVMEGIEKYNRQISVKHTEEQYIKHGSTWFSGEGWDDEYDFTPNSNSARDKSSNPFLDMLEEEGYE